MSSTSRRVTLPTAREKTQRVWRSVLRLVALAAIVAGMVSLFGVWPMNSRTTEVILGIGSLLAAVLLVAVSNRKKSPPGL
jgi:high-affinity Fe2+/Pb2+ permease